MDELREKIRKTNEKISRSGEKEKRKHNDIAREIQSKMKENILSDNYTEELEKIRDFIKKYDK